MTKYELGKRIKQARKEVEMTQRELARAMQLSFQQISAIEVGRSIPDALQLIALSEILKKDINYFVKE